MKNLSSRCLEKYDDGCLGGVAGDHFRSRTGQRDMIKAVADAIDDKQCLIVEGGTGLGKTCAYLLPAVLSGKRILISVGTRHLQEQVYEDLKELLPAVEQSADIALLKGQSNYLCLRRLEAERGVGGDLLDKDRIHFLSRVVQWSRETETGELGELGLEDEDPRLQKLTSSSVDKCHECAKYADCFVRRARKRAREADITVVNHHLLLHDIKLKEEGGQFLPEADIVIVDEAHRLADTADMILTDGVSSRQINNLARNLEEHGAWEESSDLRETTEAMKQSCAGLVSAFQQTPKEGGGEEELDDPLFRKALTDMVGALAAMSKVLETLQSRDDMPDSYLQQLKQWREHCDAVLDPKAAGKATGARWYERTDRSFALHSTPMDVASLSLFQSESESGRRKTTWIYTSATLSVAGDFTHFQKRLGVECDSLVIDSPYDYARQVSLYIPELPPLSYRDEDNPHLRAFIDACKRCWDKMEGGALLLFTRKTALEAAEQYLTGRTDRPVLVQGRAPKSELLERFKQEYGVLLGLESFWEGVDVPGPHLRLLAIHQLPFKSPGDPLTAKRIQYYEENSLNHFGDVALPDAVIKFRQGVGRLIRRETDDGVVLIGDSRALDKYGKKFLNSLPKMKRHESDDNRFQSTPGRREKTRRR